MAQTLGRVWKTRNGVVLPTELRQGAAAQTPVAGDLVQMINTAGVPEVQAIVAANANTGTTDITVYGICTSNPSSKLNSPGYTAQGANSEDVPTASFGGVGSRAHSTAPVRQRFVARLTPQDEILMTPTTDAGVAGAVYGLSRNAAGEWLLNIAGIPAGGKGFKIVGFYDPDVRAGAALRRVWVSPTHAYTG